MSEAPLDFTVDRLGEAKIPSPLHLSKVMDDFIANYVTDDEYILYNISCTGESTREIRREELLEKAGPREHLYFDPSKVSAAIVTCGGLCPGLNDVIRSLVMCLWYHYGVHNILGIRNGYRGFLPEYGLEPMSLTPNSVARIHRQGGTVLGSSRGMGTRTEEIVDAIERMNLHLLFVIGGDGTQKGALMIHEEAKRRGRKLAVVGVPKTIDNDLSFVEKTFGFETAVSLAVQAVAAAHVEATGAIRGVGLVKVMGRESGFIAASTALALNDVNFVLVPEVPFDLEGEKGLLSILDKRLDERGHAVILVAEGAGQDLMAIDAATDESGNKKLGNVGPYLKQKILEDAKRRGKELNIKYIDPSYMIRAAPANAVDSIYCERLGTNAVHAAMSGRTGVLVSLINNTYVHVPIRESVKNRNRIDPESALWRDVIIATGQPALMVDDAEEARARLRER